jgi:hypothetical protein
MAPINSGEPQAVLADDLSRQGGSRSRRIGVVPEPKNERNHEALLKYCLNTSRWRLKESTGSARSQAIAKMQYCRRMAMLPAFAHVYEGRAQDYAVDLLHQLTSTSVRRAEKRGEGKRLETIPELDTAALTLRDVARIVLDPLHADASERGPIPTLRLVANSNITAV